MKSILLLVRPTLSKRLDIEHLNIWTLNIVYAFCKRLNVCQIDVDLVNLVTHTHTRTHPWFWSTIPLEWRRHDEKMICWLRAYIFMHSMRFIMCVRTNVWQFIYTLTQLSIYTLAIVVMGPVRNVISLACSHWIRGPLICTRQSVRICCNSIYCLKLFGLLKCSVHFEIFLQLNSVGSFSFETFLRVK